MPHRVAIVGGGFGGLYAARALQRQDVSVTLVDRRNFHLFQPLLYQAATGQLSAGDIAAPLRSVFRHRDNVRVLLGDVVDVDPAAKRLQLADGDRIEWDSLIVAAGADNFYFGRDEWAHVAPGLKTIEDAIRIRHHILFAFEAAERESDPERRRAWLTFIVVGGGPTGVELAGALGEIANDVLQGEFRSIQPSEAQILLVEGGPRILGTYGEDSSAAAERSLIALGVRTRTGVRVTSIVEDGVHFESAGTKGFIAARTVLWAAGVRASPLGRVLQQRTGCELDRGGRIVVAPDCTVPGHPDLFVIGDLANCRQPDGSLVPGVAPAAMQMGAYAARVIRDRLAGKTTPPFRYRNKGSMAVIGRAAGVAELGRFHFGGLLAWLLWLFVHLMYLVGFQNRLVVFVRWGFSYLTYNRGSRLITGEPVADAVQRPATTHM
jgi:NADH:ubiquinone reductase (H+-translocating)